jgi:transposase
VRDGAVAEHGSPLDDALVAAPGADHWRGFAKRLRRDHTAVAAALVHPWGTGPAEGEIMRLKLIKRQMFGRANLDLLRARVLAA